MPHLLLFVALIVVLWLLIRFNNFGKRLSPLAFFKQVENGKPITVIKPSQPVVVKPAAELIAVMPRNTVVVKPAPVFVIQPKTAEVVTVQPTRAVTVTPPERGAWDERGWTRIINDGREIYEGYYVVGSRKFRGRIETRGGRNIAVYIFNPPGEVKRHRHGACFQLVNNNWFHLHWSRPARNVDDAILYMERVLDESLNG